MEMYREHYALALLLDGKIQKESDDGTVLIPFGSEYSLRLKNKLRKRAVADIFIDGRISAKGIVIEANGTVDLERFVEDGQLAEGKKFKLVRVEDPKVEQPNDSENGIIEVNFYPEKDAPVIEKTVIHEYKHDCYHWGHHGIGHCYQCCGVAGCSICNPWSYKQINVQPTVWYGSSGNITTTLSSGDFTANGGITYTGGGVSGNSCSSSNMMAMNCSSPVAPEVGQASAPSNPLFSVGDLKNAGEAAATIQGSTSLQKFSSIYVDVDRSKPVTLRLKVKGLSKVLDACPACGYKRKKDVKFCPNDGTQLVA